MQETYQIKFLKKPKWDAIGPQLQAFNTQHTGDKRHDNICYVVRAENQAIMGGLIAEVYWGWLYINLLWLHEDLRGRGYGHQLLTLAEDKGRAMGAVNAYLDTFSFKAPEFYKAHGYQVFGELHDFPPGHQRYFFQKKL